MATEIARSRATRAWCRPMTRGKMLDIDLVEAFAEIIDEYREILIRRGNEEMDTTSWLIERGQQQNHIPTIWWAGERVVGQWTDQVGLAIRFSRKEDAELVGSMLSHLIGEKTLMWTAIQHCWIDYP